MTLIDSQYKLSQAIDLAEISHKGQKYGDNDYFAYHVLDVLDHVENNKSIPRNIHDECCVVAALHDIVEDTDTTIEQIKELFNDEIVEAVIAITYVKGKETRKEYYERIKANKIATYVKYSDALVNLKNSVLEDNIDRADYYSLLVDTLEQHLLGE